jgi:hypothetical protein
MTLRAPIALAAVALFALGGCSSGDKNAQAGESPAPVVTSVAESPAGEPSPSVSPSPAIEFTVDGGGPYVIGAKLADLQGQNLLIDVATGAETCPQNTTAKGTGTWAGVQVAFRPDGKLYMAVNRSKTIPTPSGAWIGMTLAAIQSIYGTIGQQLDGGGGVAYLVTTDSGRGLLFDFDQNKKVMTMIAGDAKYLKSSYLGGSDFC